MASLRRVFFKGNCPHSFDQLTAIEQKVRPVETREELRSIHTFILNIFLRIEALHNHKRFSSEIVLKSFIDVDDSVFQKKFEKKLENQMPILKEKFNVERAKLFSSIDDIRFLAQLLLDFIEELAKPPVSEKAIIDIFEEEILDSEVEEDKEKNNGPELKAKTNSLMIPKLQGSQMSSTESMKASFYSQSGPDSDIIEKLMLNGELNVKILKKLLKSEFYLIHRIAGFFRILVFNHDKEHPQEKIIHWVNLGIGRFAIALLHKREETDLLFIKRTLLSCDFKAQKPVYYLYLLIKAFVQAEDFPKIIDHYQVENSLFSNMTQIHLFKNQKHKSKIPSMASVAETPHMVEIHQNKLDGFNEVQQNVLNGKYKKDNMDSILDKLDGNEKKETTLDLPPIKSKKN